MRRRFFSNLIDKNIPEGKLANRFLDYLSLGLLFIISTAYFYWFRNGLFFHQETNMLFIFSGDYFQRFTLQPGGLLVYASNFLTQFYFNPLFGSLLISSLLILLCIVFIKIYHRLSAHNSYTLFFILLPSCGLFILQTRFDLLLQYSLGYLLTVFWFLLSIFPAKKFLNVVTLVLFPVFYYLVGSFALIYLGMYLIFNLLYEKGMMRVLLAFLIGFAFFTFIIFKEVLFLQPVDLLLGYPLSYFDSSRLTSFLDLLSGFIVLFPVFIITSGQFNVNKKFEGFIPFVTILVVFPVVIFLLSKFYDPALENLTKLEKSAYRQDWDAVIKQHERHPSSNVFGQYFYNLALSEKGQLCNRLFFGHQNYGPLSLTLPTDIEQADKSVYFYYAIGLVSQAHHLAYELMVVHGYRPENIKMLIKTELINGNYKIARRYIDVLKKTLYYRKWAKKYETMNFNPALINADPELGEKIRLLPKKDFFIGTNDVQNIELVLRENPDNKRAFEYKIARLLLEKDFMAVVNEIKNMKEIGYNNIPRHIEEASVACLFFTGALPDLGGLTIKPETNERFLQYREVYNEFKGDKSQVDRHMNNAEKNTFWYYLHFGNIRSDFLKSKPVDNSVY
jgi:hypothetical protein